MISQNVKSFLTAAPTDFLNTETGQKIIAKETKDWT
jgi:hypothetical protein